MIYRRRPSLRGPVLAITALLTVAAAISGLAGAETGAPRTEATLSIISDSTPPDDPTDGNIQTFDIAKFLLNVSQNGADATSPVVATVSVTNGVLASVPPACDASSTVSSDQTTLNCGLGVLAQGTSAAIEYEVRASGEVADGDLLTGSVAVGDNDPIPQAPLTITGTNRLDVAKRTISADRSIEAGAPAGWTLTYDFEIRTGDANNKGGLPLDEVTFIDDWSDIKATWPDATLISGPDLEPTGAAHGTTGTWTATADGTEISVVASGFGNSPAPGSSIVSSRRIQFFVPHSSAPIGTSSAINELTSITGTPRGGPADSISDYDPSNNESGASITMLIGDSGKNARSAWVSTSYGRSVTSTQDPTISGTTSQYRRPLVWSWLRTSGGEQTVYGGETILAEATAESLPWQVTNTNPDGAACIKFDRDVTGGGDAEVFIGDELSPSAAQVPASYRIEYGTVTDPVGSACNDAAASWSTARPSSFNAVRAWGDMRVVGSSMRHLVLRVPVTVPSGLPARTLLGFHNTLAFGNFGATSLGATADDIEEWSGLGGYDVDSNTGDGRFGDRIWVVPATATMSKSVCDGPISPSIAVGDSVEFCLTAQLDGVGSIPNLKIVDAAIYSPPGGGGLQSGNLGDPDSPMAYVPGSSTVRFNSSTTSLEPAVGTDGELTWDINSSSLNVSAPGTVEVRFTARSQIGVASPGGTFINYGSVEGDTLAPLTASGTASNPHVGVTVASFATGRAQLQIEKSKSTPDLVAPNDTITWDVTLGNHGVTVVGSTDIIDILPYVGDGDQNRFPASDFAGTVALDAAPTASSGTLTYSSASPDTVDSDPAHPSNRPGGATLWCLEADFGEAGCPTGFGDVTALRVTDDNPIAPGDAVTISIPMSTDGNEAGDIYTNDAGAAVRDSEPGPVLSVRSNDVTVTVASPGLAITKSTEDQVFAPGTVNTYTIVASNTSDLTEPEAVVSDRLVDGLEFVEASNGAVFDPDTRTVTWPATELRPDDEVTYTLTVQVADPAPAAMVVDGAVWNTAAITGTRSCEAGPLEPNCTSTVSNPVEAPQLRFGKTVDATEAVPGDELTWTLTVTNDGDLDATDVNVTDTLPGGVTVGGPSTGTGTLTDNTDGTITWAIGDLAVGQTVAATVTATIDDHQWGSTLINRMDITSGECFGACPPPVVEQPCEGDPTASCATTVTPGLPGVPDPIDGPDPDPTDPEAPLPPGPATPEPPADSGSNATPVTSSGEELARTGSNVGSLLVAGASLVLGGFGLRMWLRQTDDELAEDDEPDDDIWA